MGSDPVISAANQIRGIRETVEKIVDRDGTESEIEGVGLISINSVLRIAKDAIPDHPVVREIHAAITPDHVRPDGRVRAAEMLLLLRAVEGALRSRFPTIPDPHYRRFGRRD